MQTSWNLRTRKLAAVPLRTGLEAVFAVEAFQLIQAGEASSTWKLQLQITGVEIMGAVAKLCV